MFTIESFSPVGAVSTAAPAFYSYETPDTITEVIADGYFIGVSFADRDLVRVDCADGILDIIYNGTAFVVAEQSKEPTKTTIVVSKSDFPTPVGGVITLDANTKYLVGADVDVGTDRFVVGDRTVVTGDESLVYTLTYTGTGDMFTGVNTTNRFNRLTFACPNGRLFNWNDSVGASTLIVENASFPSPDRFGTFNGTRAGLAGSILRFTNISLVGVATNGLEFTGDFFSLLWEVGAVAISNGDAFDWGTATFDNATINDSFLILMGAGAVGIRGLANSGNINAGGIGQINSLRFSGPGTPIVGLSEDDSLIDFLHNDDLADSRESALLTMTGNATQTVISATNTPVKIAGTWTVKRVSRLTADTTGRVDSALGRNAILPIELAITASAASGTNKDINAYIAVDGVVDPDSQTPLRVDANDVKHATIPYELEFTPTTYIEAFIENTTDTTNILVSQAIIRI